LTSARIDRDTIISLAAQHCAGQLAPPDAQRLADALRDDAAARQTFLEYMDLHTALAWEGSSIADLDAAGVSCAPAPRSGSILRRASRALFSTPLRVALSVATIAVAGFLAIMASTPATLLPRWGGTSTAEQEVAAHFTALVDVVWAAPREDYKRGSAIHAGKLLALEEGTVEITFVDGAIVTLTAPATFIAESPSRGKLSAGRLAASVSPPARGFTIATPGATVIDLGTEFGVLVPPRDEQTGRPLGQEELHVFSGTVDVNFGNSEVPTRRLVAGEALRFASTASEQTTEGGLEELAGSQRARFPRSIDGESKLTVAPPLPPEKHPPVTRQLVLWLAADGALNCTSDGHVAVWQAMRAGDVRQLHHARQTFMQRRPVFVAEAFNGQPAIRFDGDDYLALPGPHHLGISAQPYEIYVVGRSSSPEIQFLIGGGTEEFEIHLNGTSGARFIPTGFFEGAGASDVGAVGEFSDGRPHLFVARILTDNDRRGQLSVDGRASDDLTTDDARGFSDMPMRLGMRNNGQFGLVGEIAEVLVYRAPLNKSEHQALQAYLANKYSLHSGD
jgi:hypothetical protein